MELTATKLSQDLSDDLMSPMTLDLIAYYNALQDDILSVLESNKDKSVDDIIHEINKIFGA